MLSSAHIAATPLGMPPGSSPQGVDQASIPLTACGPIEDEDHIVLLGGQGSELTCALLRAGATNVTHLLPHERPGGDSATLVIVPRITSPVWLVTALPTIRRALLPHGRIVLLAGPQATMVTQLRRMLKLCGLTNIRTAICSAGHVVSAERA